MKRDREKLEAFEKELAGAFAQGTPLTIALAARLTGVTRQRIWMLIREGTLQRVKWEGWNFVTLESVCRWRTGSEKLPRKIRSLAARRRLEAKPVKLVPEKPPVGEPIYRAYGT